MQRYPQQRALSCTNNVQQRKVLVAGVRITRASESWTCTRNMHTRSKLTDPISAATEHAKQCDVRKVREGALGKPAVLDTHGRSKLDKSF